MTPSRLSRAAAIVSVAGAVAAGIAPADGAAQPTLSDVRAVSYPTALTAYNGVLVWSEFDPATALFHLTALEHGHVEPLPVAPRAAVFDADLGPGPDGHLNAVYSRCAPESPQQTLYWPGVYGNCDLYRYDFASGQEHALVAFNTAASEQQPTVWGSRVAFTRITQRSGTPQHAALELGDLHSSAVRELARQPGADGFVGRGGQPSVGASSGMDLRDDRLAVTWTWGGRTRGVPYVASRVTLMDVSRRRDAARVLEGATSTGIPTVGFFSPSLTSKSVTYGRFAGRDRGETVIYRRFQLTGSTLMTASGGPPATGLATAQGHTWIAFAAIPTVPGNSCTTLTVTPVPCGIARLGQLRFRPVRTATPG